MSFGSVLLQFYTPNIFKAAIVQTTKLVDISKDPPNSNLLTKANLPGDVTIGNQDLFEIIYFMKINLFK